MLELAAGLRSALAAPDSGPGGLLRITVSTSFAQAQMARAVAAYVDRYPEISVDRVVPDRAVNLVDERIDLAIRITNDIDTNLVARGLTVCRSVVCASPACRCRDSAPMSRRPAKAGPGLRLHRGRVSRGAPVASPVASEWQNLPMSQQRAVSIGEVFSREHMLTRSEVVSFALAAGDDNPLHHDEEHAAASRYRGLIASGTHTTALLLGLTASHFSKQASVVGVEFAVKFKRAVLADQKVRVQWTVSRLEPYEKGAGQRVHLIGQLLDSHGVVCVTATGQVLVGLSG